MGSCGMYPISRPFVGKMVWPLVQNLGLRDVCTKLSLTPIPKKDLKPVLNHLRYYGYYKLVVRQPLLIFLDEFAPSSLPHRSSVF